MATGTAGSKGQMYHTNQVHYFARTFSYTDDGSVLTLGTMPPGACVLEAGVHVHTAFNSGSTNVLDIGTSADDDGFATDLALGTIGRIVADEMATTNDGYSATADGEHHRDGRSDRHGGLGRLGDRLCDVHRARHGALIGNQGRGNPALHPFGG
ncbi:MAG: hypothetical protein IPL79_20495 [Myxococcales bacterium]|nr:hypothetical protein [Myxococcales bacterium]